MTLKRNSKRILDAYVAQGSKNARKAYLSVHPDAKVTTAGSRAHDLLKKPEAQIYLQQHVDRAKETIVDLLKSEKDDIRLRSAVDILDRSTGKAIQRTENVSTGITLSIDLSSALDNDIIEGDVVQST